MTMEGENIQQQLNFIEYCCKFMSEQKNYYTNEKNAQIVIALLKAHGIRKVILNPGTANIAFSGGVQHDPWFETYSGVDERHSAYMAVGMAAESGEPVVLSCTGATASRNYLPGLTEAYYRKLPVLAITSSHRFGAVGSLLPQMIDRRVVPNDCVRFSLQCPVPHTVQQIEDCVTGVNKAILELSHHGGGPVHINLETERGFAFSMGEEPRYRVINRIEPDSATWPKISSDAKVAIWVGSHKAFTENQVNAIEKFVRSNDAVVVCDKTSAYHGYGRVDGALIGQQEGAWKNPRYRSLMPTLVVHIGGISGDYESYGFFSFAKEVWRVNEDGDVEDLFGKLTNVFEMSIESFSDHYSSIAKDKCGYFEAVNASYDTLVHKLPELPFSNIWIASQLSSRIPPGSVLHLGILNSLRSWNLFTLSNDVESYCNVGGFGIDGCVSTMIGASLVSPKKTFFGVFGDLAFFYDLNSLGNRHIGPNLRILVVNNGCGGEFILHNNPANDCGVVVEDYIAAGRHFGNKSTVLLKNFASDIGFDYLSASSKEEFEYAIDVFVNQNSSKPILFECFTEAEDEDKALFAIKEINPYHSNSLSTTGAIKAFVPQRVKNVLKAAMGK